MMQRRPMVAQQQAPVAQQQAPVAVRREMELPVPLQQARYAPPGPPAGRPPAGGPQRPIILDPNEPQPEGWDGQEEEPPIPALPCNLVTPIPVAGNYMDSHIEWTISKNQANEIIKCRGKIKGTNITIQIGDCAYYNGLYGRIVNILYIHQKNVDRDDMYTVDCVRPLRPKIPFTFIFRSQKYPPGQDAGKYYDLLMYNFEPANFKLITKESDPLLYNSIFNTTPGDYISYVREEKDEELYVNSQTKILPESTFNNMLNRLKIEEEINAEPPPPEPSIVRRLIAKFPFVSSEPIQDTPENIVKRGIINLEAEIGWVELHRQMRYINYRFEGYENHFENFVANINAAIDPTAEATIIIGEEKTHLLNERNGLTTALENVNQLLATGPRGDDLRNANNSKAAILKSSKENWRNTVMYKTIELMFFSNLRKGLIKALETTRPPILTPNVNELPQQLPDLPVNIDANIRSNIELLKEYIKELDDRTPLKKEYNDYIQSLQSYYEKSIDEIMLYKQTLFSSKFINLNDKFRGYNRKRLQARNNPPEEADYDEYTVLQAVHNVAVNREQINIQDFIAQLKMDGIKIHKLYGPNVVYFPPDFTFVNELAPADYQLNRTDSLQNGVIAINNLFGTDKVTYLPNSRERVSANNIINMAVVCAAGHSEKYLRKQRVAQEQKTLENQKKTRFSRNKGYPPNIRNKKHVDKLIQNYSWKSNSEIPYLDLGTYCIQPPPGQSPGLSMSAIDDVITNDLKYVTIRQNIHIKTTERGEYIRNIFDWFGKFIKILSERDTIGAILRKKTAPDIYQYYTITTTSDQPKYRFIFNTPSNELNGGAGPELTSCVVNEYELLRLLGKLNNVYEILYVKYKADSLDTVAKTKADTRSPDFKTQVDKKVDSFLKYDFQILSEIISKTNININKKYVPFGFNQFVAGADPMQLVPYTEKPIYENLIKPHSYTAPEVRPLESTGLNLRTTGATRTDLPVLEIIPMPPDVSSTTRRTPNPWYDPDIAAYAEETKGLLKYIYTKAGGAAYQIAKTFTINKLNEAIEKAKEVANLPVPFIPSDKIKVWHVATLLLELPLLYFVPALITPQIVAGTGVGAHFGIREVAKKIKEVEENPALTPEKKNNILAIYGGEILGGLFAAGLVIGIAYLKTKRKGGSRKTRKNRKYRK